MEKRHYLESSICNSTDIYRGRRRRSTPYWIAVNPGRLCFFCFFSVALGCFKTPLRKLPKRHSSTIASCPTEYKRSQSLCVLCVGSLLCVWP
ncbi:hypothetical protein M440DRAFT_1225238 [Trichoderma longibrachiatum ATCC 18648]|uniref:Uncharacterized protein n=1 Tax=Trichoderma longibrachiatum ATCC 18648 TaxID=983965 RepID=A0A2T4C8E3_TRILO|nr:hypothetical protein M440DRAFT_1225238 [Trichoderma longibrachiatum ATCC 18648]